MTELSLGEGKSKIIRYVSTVIFVTSLVLTFVFSGLAGPGRAPFQQSTGSVSDQNHICITPAAFTFGIWGVIYFLLVIIAIYAITILFYKIGFDKVWQLGGAISVPFLLVTSVNFALNISWLFAWDAENMVASAIILVLVVLTNVTALVSAAMSFKKASNRLYSISKKDFWMNFVVLNGHCVYVTWTIIASLLNIGIAITSQYKENYDRPSEFIQNDVCIAILSVLLVCFILYFILEQTLLKRGANPLITHYMVYVWAMIGALVENSGSASPTVTNLTIANLSFAVLLLLCRLVALAVRNFRNAIYTSI